MRVLFGMCVSSIIQEFVPMLTNNSKKNFKSQRPSLAHIKKKWKNHNKKKLQRENTFRNVQKEQGVVDYQ